MNGGSPFVLRMRHWMATLGLAKKTAMVPASPIGAPAAEKPGCDAPESEIKLLERNIVDATPRLHSGN